MPAAKKATLRKKLLLAAAAAAASLVVSEVFLRLFASIPMAPFLRDYDPDLGVRYKPNLDATITYPEFSMKWSTNARGFRGPRPPPSSKGCVLIIGDSYSEGWGVNDDEVYASLLREALDARYGRGVVPVINASMSASGNGRWIKLLRGDLADYEPRLVLFQACFNDSRDNVREGQFALLGFHRGPWGPLGRAELIETTGRQESWLRYVQPVLEAIPGLEDSRVFGLIRNMARNQEEDTRGWRLDLDEPEGPSRRAHSPPGVESGRQLYRGDVLFVGLIEQSLAICRRRGWPAALMSVRIGDTRIEELQKMCDRFDAPLLDIRNREAHPEYYYAVDSHWTPAGHRWVADLILERLLDADSRYLRGLEAK